jgi:hypothetical protein
MIRWYIILLFVVLLTTSQKESFRTNQITTSDAISTLMTNVSPSRIIEGIHKRVHPYIPFKHHYYKLKRRFRNQ